MSADNHLDCLPESDDQQELIRLSDQIHILRYDLKSAIQDRDEAIISSGRMANELANSREEIVSALNFMPHPIRVHEGNGPENIYASLALSVASVVKELTKVKEINRKNLARETPNTRP